eukprot:3891062-Prymnesium_polylepis.1
MFALSPSQHRFNALVAALPAYVAAHPDFLRHYSEQHFLACELQNVSDVLPCGFLLDTHAAWSTSCRSLLGTRSREVCLKIFQRECNQHNNIVHGVKRREVACDSAVRHMQERCVDGGGTRAIRAIHFKGKHKPWTARSRDCEKTRDGFMLQMELGNTSDWRQEFHPSKLTPVDPLGTEVSWLAEKSLCMVIGSGSPLFWASGEPVTAERCCSSWLVFASHWFGLLDTLRARMYRIST